MCKDPTAEARLLQRMLREPSHSDAAMIAEHEAQVKPVSRVKDPRSATGWPGTGLEHHQPIVHLSQKLGVYTLSNVGDLVWICSYVIDFYKYLEAKRRRKEESKGYTEEILLWPLFINERKEVRKTPRPVHHVV